MTMFVKEGGVLLLLKKTHTLFFFVCEIVCCILFCKQLYSTWYYGNIIILRETQRTDLFVEVKGHTAY